MRKILLLSILSAGAAFAQCGAAGMLIFNPISGIFDCTAVGGAGQGSVTLVTFTGGLISVADATSAPALTVAGTSGGIPYFSGAATWASSGVLGANLPVFGGGAGAAPIAGTRSGNTTKVVTTTGTLTSGDCVKIDASGNFIAQGSACGTGSGDVVGPGSATDNGFVKFDGTTGKLVKNSAATVASADLNITTTTCTNQLVSAIGATGVGSCHTIVQADLPATTKARAISFSIGDPGGSALTAAATTTAYVTVPFACTISAYNLMIDAGTITVKFWKVATGTAIPTSSNSINTSGVAIATGTAIHSATVSDFTSTTVTKDDMMAMNVTATATAKYVSGVLQCDQ